MNIVIGSGPSGFAATKALLEKNKKVIMLDAGIKLEKNKLDRLNNIKPMNFDKFKESKWINDNQEISISGVKDKLSYGSDFSYRSADKQYIINNEKIKFKPSFAQGGFSNVWGGAVLPFLQSEIENWPINYKDLEKGYRKVINMLDISGKRDHLEDKFSFFTEKIMDYDNSAQAKAILAKLNSNYSHLKNHGIQFGSARLAVKMSNENKQKNCLYCGLCLNGCPIKIIFNTSFKLSELLQDNRFSYIGNVIVNKLEEQGGEVKIYAKDRLTGENLIYNAEKVYLGAGVLPTLGIILESLGLKKLKLEIKQSQYFLLPLYFNNNISGITNEELHTLAQLFIEITDNSISKNSIHLQLYTYNQFLNQLIQKYKIAKILPKVFKEKIISSLLTIQGYFHSDESIAANIQAVSSGGKIKIDLDNKLKSNVFMHQNIRKLVKKLFLFRRFLGFTPIYPLLKIGDFGEGYHVGSTFPMSSSPEKYSTDTLGRLNNYENIHIIDASILPSIPATTITFTIMANAFRIANDS